MLKEMRENGELDTQIYQKIKTDMNSVKMQDVIPKEHPSQTAEMKYPDHALNLGSLLYRTQNMNYGSSVPNKQDLPCNFVQIFNFYLEKYFPRPVSFTKTF